MRLKAETEKDRTEIDALEREVAQLREALARQSSGSGAGADPAELESKLRDREQTLTRLMGTIKEHEATIKKLTESAESWKRKYQFLSSDSPDAYKTSVRNEVAARVPGMETLLRAFDLTAALNSRGISFASLGAAYLVFIGTCIATAALFSAARKHLVVAPNRQSRNYALYVIAVLCTLLIATALENELSAAAVPTLRYVAYPQIAFLLALHIWIAYRTEPWLIQLGASSLVGSALVAASAPRPRRTRSASRTASRCS